MGARHDDEETEAMKCTVCGADLTSTQTDLPFKLRETSIVILKNLPVLQCRNCPEYLIEDEVMRHVDQILAGVDNTSAEVEIIRYAA
jgi:YgiT-type zinc finger domain-containing protein